MTVLGAVLTCVAVAAAVVGVRGTSSVARTLDLIAPSARRSSARWQPVPELQLRHAGVALDPDRFLAVKIASTLAAALLASILALVAPIGPLIVPLAAYAGFIVPSAIVDHRAASRRTAAEAEISVLVERLEALVVAGRPPETALASLARRSTGAALLDGVLHRTADAYSLGAPLFRTLAAEARAEGLVTCASVADDLERARDLGTGAIGVIRERRSSLRAAERARRLEAAAQVDAKLMLVLVLCYLPALVLLVVVPLFLGLLEGLLA